jgi:methionine aminotransferase
MRIFNKNKNKNKKMKIESKFPNVGTSIFAVMSKMARDNNAINLAQGFPNFDCDEQIKE